VQHAVLGIGFLALLLLGSFWQVPKPILTGSVHDFTGLKQLAVHGALHHRLVMPRHRLHHRQSLQHLAQHV
jgi:hypothetical protein